jgi:ubiquinol-cytochrome c reductase cytochrome b subunit
MLRAFLDWFDSRTGIRAARAHLLDEPIPAGTGWSFVTGSVVLFLIVVQLATGVVLTMYYVPAPDHAYASIRFIMDQLPFGSVLRGLHFFGASFIVVAALVHMLRVVALGSYKKPREVTWLTGVILLLLILGFALSGYLLPWDQKAYWATTVTINVARSGPMGEYVAGLLRGGSGLGPLTLLRWYSAHVFLLPACLIGFIVAHIYLMRRHGISGPVSPVAGAARPFYPYHALKDTLAIALVFAALIGFAVAFRAPLDAVADPTDATYVPRPEWYFLSLFQLLKYFPGPLEPVATQGVPGLVVLFLFLLPFLGKGTSRRLRDRPVVATMFVLIGLGVSGLTVMGLRDTPGHSASEGWSPLAVAGSQFVTDARCTTCHRPGGAASEITSLAMLKDPDWLLSHVRDPQIIAPGLREPPSGGMSPGQAQSVLSYSKRVRAGKPVPPAMDADTRTASLVLGRYCATCHMIDGEGSAGAPDLTHAGKDRDAKWLHDWISAPDEIDAGANMPGFRDFLTAEQMAALVKYLAARK